jgi:hypothetical protein
MVIVTMPAIRMRVGEWRQRTERADDRQRLGPVDAADPVGASRPGVEVQEDDRDDLPEAQRDDRQVVAAQAQGRRAEGDPEDGRHRGADDEHRQERQVEARERRVRIGVRVGADGEERRVAQVEQAGQPDDHVEAHRQQHEDAGIGERIEPRQLALHDRERGNSGRKVRRSR